MLSLPGLKARVSRTKVMTGLRRINSPEDDMRGIVSYELSNGFRVQFNKRHIMQYGVYMQSQRAHLA